MTIAVSGGNGFTGRFVCMELQRRRQSFVALLRPGSDSSWMEARQIPCRFADLNNAVQLAEQLRGCRALLNVASIGFGAAPRVVEACQVAGVQRAVFVSTTAIFTQLNAGSKAVRQAAEAAIINSDLATTILRPTMIYGTPGDRNMIRLVRWLDCYPFLPIFGNGRSLQQPVHVSDVAWALVQTLKSPETIGRQFNLSGLEALSFNDIVRITTKTLGRRVYRFHVPEKAMVALLQFSERINITLPIKSEQILRLNEDKSFSHFEAHEAFGYSPKSFEEGIREEVSLFHVGGDGLSSC